MGGKVDPPGIVQEIQIWAYKPVAYVQHKIRPGEQEK